MPASGGESKTKGGLNMSGKKLGTPKGADALYQRISPFDIATKGKVRAGREDLFLWGLGRQRCVNFTIYMRSQSGIEYKACEIVRIATVYEATRGRARWQSTRLDGERHSYRTRRRAILNSAQACRFCANPPKAFTQHPWFPAAATAPGTCHAGRP